MTESPKNILITGGATGLGYFIAEKLLQDGHKVICTSRDLSKLPQEALSLKQKGCTWLPLDLSQPESIDQFFDDAFKFFNGRIDVLINSAAYALMGAMEDIP